MDKDFSDKMILGFWPQPLDSGRNFPIKGDSNSGVGANRD
jgi:hypothetical protein